MKPEFWSKMFPHLFSADWYIGGWALLTGVLMFYVRLKAKDVARWFEEAPASRSLTALTGSRRRLSIVYTLFTTFISIFPLLGMFGTVQALVGLDLTGEMEGVKQHFFEALTSTAWGIIFAVIFKVLHAAFAAHDAEEMLAKSGRFLDARERPGAARQEEQ
ncbi:MAG: MotA/TolQ/ExbB proton channel family protein [Oscillospiraceae bacterium]|nr:MotA/TolQ/ExbB proton channel family protein [Oscillospiraceae bacterium]